MKRKRARDLFLEKFRNNLVKLECSQKKKEKQTKTGAFYSNTKTMELEIWSELI